MATPKKSTTKKPAAKKPTTKAAASKSTAKKTPVASAAKSTTKPGRHHRLFALSIVPDDKPFFTFRLTTQTVYWLIFALAIFSLGLWVLKLNLQIADLYNQIDQNNVTDSMINQSTSVKKPVTHP